MDGVIQQRVAVGDVFEFSKKFNVLSDSFNVYKGKDLC